MDLIKHLCQLVKLTNIKFTLYGKPIKYEEVFADIGLLPSIAQRADRLCSLCFGYGIGITFAEAENSILGTRVQFDETTPNVLRIMFIYDVILEIVESSSEQEEISLDELLYD